MNYLLEKIFNKVYFNNEEVIHETSNLFLNHSNIFSNFHRVERDQFEKRKNRRKRRLK